MVSVIIVNYRSWKYLANCLNVLQKIKGIEIIVVDNYSNDNSLVTFKRDFPTINWIESGSNLGFGKACNLGADHSKGDFLLFLNPDTIANEEAINKMKAFLVDNNDYKIVSCKQHEQLKKHYLVFPNVLTIFGFLRAIYVNSQLNRFKTKHSKSFEYIEPDWVSGSVVLMSKKWFVKIAGWSPAFWMYSEDVDICKKTALNNGKIALLTNVEIYHKHGGASRLNIQTTAMAKAEVIKSKHVYFQKYFKGLSRIVSHSIFIISFLFIKSVLALLGILFFYIPKAFVQSVIFKNLSKYYLKVIKTGNWQSEKVI